VIPRIMSNKSLTEWGGSYTTPPSRPPSSTVLLHHGGVYYLKGDSFRLRGKPKTEPPEPPVPAETADQGG
jgi:hypothetical protein